MEPHIALVVEGHGDFAAVPDLTRRYLAERGYSGVAVGKPINAKSRGKLLKAGELERFSLLAAREPGAAGLLVVCDSDRDPACSLGPACLARIPPDVQVPTKICLAIREFENWIVASAETVHDDLKPLSDCEGGGAEVAIRQALKPRAYVKPRDQPALCSRIDLNLGRQRSPSLNRFLRCVDELADEILETSG